jgi:hypothetical protein
VDPENVWENVGIENVVLEGSDQVLPRAKSTSFLGVSTSAFWAEHEAANTRIADQRSILFMG